jgi:hypothetical protein
MSGLVSRRLSTVCFKIKVAAKMLMVRGGAVGCRGRRGCVFVWHLHGVCETLPVPDLTAAASLL